MPSARQWDSGSEMQERCGCLRSHTFSAVNHGCLAHKTTTKCCIWPLVSVSLRLVSTKVTRRWRQFSLFRAGQPASGAGLGRFFVEVMNGDKINAKVKQVGNW